MYERSQDRLIRRVPEFFFTDPALDRCQSKVASENHMDGNIDASRGTDSFSGSREKISCICSHDLQSLASLSSSFIWATRGVEARNRAAEPSRKSLPTSRSDYGESEFRDGATCVLAKSRWKRRQSPRVKWQNRPLLVCSASKSLLS